MKGKAKDPCIKWPFRGNCRTLNVEKKLDNQIKQLFFSIKELWVFAAFVVLCAQVSFFSHF